MLLLRRLIAIASIPLLVLPPGWCCLCVPADTEAAEAINEACCQHCPAGPVERNDTRPDPPREECCCYRDATLPASPPQPLEPQPLEEAAAVDLRASCRPAGRSWPPGIPVLDPGPRLHVLKCVWRC